MGIWQQITGHREAAANDGFDPHAKIRTESPANAEMRVHHLERSVKAVRRKIEKTLELDATAADDDCHDRFIAQSIAHYWEPLRSKPYWDMDPETLRPLVAQIAQDYFTAFRLLAALPEECRAEPNQMHTHANKVLARTYDIYSNHVANLGAARLVQAGVDPIAAHRINGSVIRDCVDAAEETICSEPYIRPAVVRPSNDTEAFKQINYVRHYWEHSLARLKTIVAEEQQR